MRLRETVRRSTGNVVTAVDGGLGTDADGSDGWPTPGGRTVLARSSGGRGGQHGCGHLRHADGRRHGNYLPAVQQPRGDRVFRWRDAAGGVHLHDHGRRRRHHDGDVHHPVPTDGDTGPSINRGGGERLLRTRTTSPTAPWAIAVAPATCRVFGIDQRHAGGPQLRPDDRRHRAVDFGQHRLATRWPATRSRRCGIVPR